MEPIQLLSLQTIDIQAETLTVSVHYMNDGVLIEIKDEEGKGICATSATFQEGRTAPPYLR